MKEMEFNIDGNLSIQPQAMALLALLSGREWSFDVPDEVELTDISSFAWYNGREKAVCLHVKDWTSKTDQNLFVVFGENRRSDQIFVDCWVADSISLNPPTHADLPEEAYNRRRFFEYGDMHGAEQYVLELIKDFVGRSLSPLSWVCPNCKRQSDDARELIKPNKCPHCSTAVEATGDVVVPDAADPRAW